MERNNRFVNVGSLSDQLEEFLVLHDHARVDFNFNQLLESADQSTVHLDESGVYLLSVLRLVAREVHLDAPEQKEVKNFVDALDELDFAVAVDPLVLLGSLGWRLFGHLLRGVNQVL